MRLLSTASLALAVLVSGCGDSPTAPVVTGTFNLRTVNGMAPPIVLQQTLTYKLELVSGSITINSGNTFTAVHTERETEGNQTRTTTNTCTGTYAQNGNSVSFFENASQTSDCGDDYTGTVNGNTLTVAWDAQVQAVYQK